MIKDHSPNNYFGGNNDEEADDREIEVLHEVVSFLKLHPNGISHDKLFSELKSDNKLIVSCLNILFEQGRLVNEVSKTEGNIFKLLSEKEIFKMKDLTGEEAHIYEVIVSSGSNGITLNELKSQLGVTGNALQKIRKKLEKRLLIKNITIPNMKNKKVILAYDIEPSNELKGGFWCTDQQFDKSLIETISVKIIDYLSKQKSSNRKEILVFIKSTGLVNSDIKEEDLQNILNLLIFDDKIDIINTQEFGLIGKNKYSVLLTKKSDLTMNSITVLNNLKYKVQFSYLDEYIALETIPCTYCINFKFCGSDNKINPESCPHLDTFYNQIEY